MKKKIGIVALAAVLAVVTGVLLWHERTLPLYEPMGQIVRASIYFGNNADGRCFRKTVDGEAGVEQIITALDQGRYFPQKTGEAAPGTYASLCIVLHGADGAQQLVELVPLDDGNIFVCRTDEEGQKCIFTGTWPGAGDLWDSLLHPAEEITWDEWP